MTIADHRLPPPPDFEKPFPTTLRMSEEDFIAWYTFEGKAEWVDGKVIPMSPVSGIHDDLQGWIKGIMLIYVQQKHLGLVRGPQFVTRMKVGPRHVSRREPDILFISTAREKLLKPNHLEGPPDLAIEIVSPESQSRDRRDKYLEYEAAGVNEYWIIDPLSQEVEAYGLSEGHFEPIIAIRGRINSNVIKGWYLRTEWLWSDPRKDQLKVLAELGIK